ncbi:DUF998 domain-containing protein [Micromonospora sp. NPDC050980]|uniref:DUF998 domain-containing protein n=1 Tax=Micromonospora sp. NPDC050980 TaxID=3155161 RepID=UPI0033F32D0E
MTRDRLAATCWLLATALFLTANVVVGLAWRQPRFDWTEHNLSDLGNVGCGVWDTTRPRLVCSPWHPAMNAAFVAVGVLLAAGVLAGRSAFGRGRAAAVARAGTLAAAGGYVLAGVWPADVDENRHVLGAVLIFVLGNEGLLAGARAVRPAALDDRCRAGLLLGAAGLVGTAFFLARVDVGIGVGGMERVAVAPLFGWVSWAGLRLLRERRPARLS